MKKPNRHTKRNADLGRYILFIGIITLLWTTRPTRAQAQAYPLLPAPMGATDIRALDRYVNLRNEQLDAILRLNEQYQLEFSKLEESRIQEHLDRSRDAATVFQLLAEKREEFRDSEVIRRKIGDLDEQFIAKIQEVLDEVQLPGLMRLRERRERGRLRIKPLFYKTGGVFFDLSAVIEQLVFDPSDAQVLQEMMPVYEHALTLKMRKLHPIVIKEELEPYREYVRRGMGRDKLDETDGKWEIVVAESWPRYGDKGVRIAKAIDALNDSTSFRLIQRLSMSGRQRLLGAYLENVGKRPGELSTFGVAVSNAFENSARWFPGASDACEELVRKAERKLVALQRAFVASERAYRPRKHWYDRSPREVSREEYQEQFVRLADEVTALREELDGSMEGCLSPEAYAHWRTAFSRRSDQGFGSPRHTSGEDIVRGYASPVLLQMRDINRLASVVNLGSEEHTVVQGAFKLYLASSSKIQSMVESGGLKSGAAEMPLDEVTLQEIQRFDDGFFKSILREIDDDGMRKRVGWLRNARRRLLWSRNIVSSGASKVDLVVFLIDCRVTIEELESISDIVDGYDVQANQRLRARYIAAISGTTISERGIEISKAVREEHHSISRLNLQTMREIAKVIEPTKRSVLDLFNQVAFWPVVQDASAQHRAIQQALARSGVQEEELAKLLVLQTQYLADYSSLTSEMIETVVDTVYWGPGERWPEPEGEDVQQNYNRLRSQRRDLNERLRMELELLRRERTEQVSHLSLAETPLSLCTKTHPTHCAASQ